MTPQNSILAAFVLFAATAGARADVEISTSPTANMTCSDGVCAPTEMDAVLNVTDLMNLLANGNVTVTTTGSSVQATDLRVNAPFSWTAPNTLTLDAFRSITVTGAMSNEGSGGVSLITDDGGSGGALSFLGSGHIHFSNVKDALIINGTKYKLEANIKKLVFDVVAHPRGAFALATSYNAKRDGAYTSSPIAIPFTGLFSGLGNTISNLEIENMAEPSIGLFAEVATSGSVSGVNLKGVVVQGGNVAGGLVGSNNGTVTNSSTSGLINSSFIAGGLVGDNEGTIFRSSSSATVRSSSSAGGLVGGHGAGLIAESFATGSVTYNHQQSDRMDDGGLVGQVFATIRDSYARGKLNDKLTFEGGLIGFSNETISDGEISTSYSTGLIKPGPHKNPYSGGFIGNSDSKSIANCYWDTVTSGTNVGAGQGVDETGITGLTTSQFQSGLPAGFDPTIWEEDANINDGYPYLIANPPQ
jgi:hypothetical protein